MGKIKNTEWLAQIEENKDLRVYDFGAISPPPPGYVVVSMDGHYHWVNEYDEESAENINPYSVLRASWKHYRETNAGEG